MLAVIIYLAVSLTALLLGTMALRIMRLAPADAAERGLVALVLGQVLLALTILVLGLLGYLQWWALTHMLLLAALISLRNLPACLRQVRLSLSAIGRGLTHSPRRALHFAIALVVALQFIAALAPPTPNDWDGTSEHLAMAKQYARDGRIRPLWYDHHSHFPATVQMLFTLAHVFNVPRAAKLFHWGFGVVALAAALLIGRRLLSPAAGSWGALVLATTPGFAWLMGAGYVDLAAVACGLLAVYFFLRWLEGEPERALWLSALMAGAGAGAKMQALALLGVLAAGIVIARGGRGRALGLAAGYLAIALAVCGGWYLKSYMWTGNPVYPFAYELFGGKMWSAERAEAYHGFQLTYGKGELPPPEERARMSPLQRVFSGPRHPLNLLLAPINLTLDPAPFSASHQQPGSWVSDSIGPLWLALLPLLLLLPRPAPVRRLLWLLLPLWLWWLWSMQLTRYLLPTLALAAPPAGWAAAGAERHSTLLRGAVRVVVGVWTMVALALMALYVLPAAPASLGLQDTSSYLAPYPLYVVSEYINEKTPTDAKIALYGEPRGYYLDRDYLWADESHSALIDYAGVQDAAGLVRRWRRLGVTHVLVNRAYFPEPDPHSADPLVRRMGEAIREGLLTPEVTPPGSGPYLLLRIDETQARQ